MRTTNSANQVKRAANGGRKVAAKTGINSQPIGSKPKRDTSSMAVTSKTKSDKMVPNRVSNIDQVSSSSSCNSVQLEIDKSKDGSDNETLSSHADSICEEDEKVADRACDVAIDNHEDESTLNQRIEEMESQIEKLEEELREVAALEVSLYSVVPEHGSSAHKVHTPARRLSRLYIHTCKNWEQDKRCSVAKNTASGFILIAKSCGNDVPRLTFWLSNVIVLREIISQEQSSRTEAFISTLEKVESWIFSRIVESVWWQALTPHMQPPTKNVPTKSSRISGQNLGNHQQGSFAVNLWKNAFQDAFQRLCPVRAGNHECGCLRIISKMVMEQCVGRLDVAIFNAILRESAHETPTDPVSDPIVDSRVLPIPAGNLSFGSGAQLKNFVGNWTRWLSDMFGMDLDQESKSKSFHLLSDLSDLLMLPKDMLMDRHVRYEICPSIDLSLVKRILCYFTPDEFCPDPVPGSVLETLNSERVSLDGEQTFPYSAAPVLYAPPSVAAVIEKVDEFASKSHLSRNFSIVQRKGYTSDEELEELDSPLSSIIEISSFPDSGRGSQKPNLLETVINTRYNLLRPVWSE